MANNKSSLSIIDGYIQIFQRKFKDPSQEKAFVTASIQASEELWNDMSLEYTKKRIPATVLCKPDDQDLFYRKDLKRTRVHKHPFCEVLQLSAEGINYSLLVVVEVERGRYIFRPLEEIDTTSRVRPFDKISYVARKGDEQGKKMAGFLYPHIETLESYRDKTHIAEFPKIIKGLIVGLTNLEKKIQMEKIDKYITVPKLCVVQDGKIGSMIFLSYPAELGFEQEGRWLDDCKSLQEYLSEIFGNSVLPRGFKVLLDSMGLARSKERWLRLLKSPYFLSDVEKVTESIPMMYALAKTCEPLAVLMRDETQYHRWKPKVYNKCGDEVDKVLTSKKYDADAPAFLLFLFNCVKHLKSDNTLDKYRKIM